jgi:teichuronic acid biosynthesis glycosyltransferase TuaC
MKIKILFVRSGNKGQHPITQNQGQSLVDAGCVVTYFDVVGKGLFGYLSNIPRLRKQIKSDSPDVIHGHYSLCGFLSSLAFSGVPVVVSLMGSDVITSNHYYRILLRIFGRLFWKKVIVKSDEMYHRLGIDEAMIVPNGVTKKDFFFIDKSTARKKLGWPENDLIALFASDPKRKEKNYDLFRRALLLLKEQGMDIQEKHLFNLSKSEMMLYYNAANVLVLTSFHEGSPNVIKEAMFCHCPFVSVPAGDVAHWTKLTEGNVLVDYNDQQLANAIKSVTTMDYKVVNTQAIEDLDSELIAGKLKSMYIRLL